MENRSEQCIRLKETGGGVQEGASLQASLGLTLLINSSALALYSARFSLRCAFRSWCSPSRTCPSYLTLSCSSSVRDWLLLLQLLALDPGALLVDEDEQALSVVIVEQDSVAAQGTQSRFATEDLYFDEGC